MEANFGENEIRSVLQKAKIFNRNIGTYQLFAINSDFDYSVKLSNGRISIKVEELQDDAIDALTPEQLTAIANRFVSSNPEQAAPVKEPIKQELKEQPKQVVAVESKKKGKGLLWGGISVVAIVITVVVAVAIKNKSSYSPAPGYNTSIGTDYIPASTPTVAPVPVDVPRQKTQEEIKQDLFQAESSAPLNYLAANYTWKVNLAANTILEGHIANSATLVTFANVVVVANFYSKTDVLLGQERFTVMEFVPPGRTAYFKHKIKGWWKDVAKSTYQIETAEVYR